MPTCNICKTTKSTQGSWYSDLGGHEHYICPSCLMWGTGPEANLARAKVRRVKKGERLCMKQKRT